MDRLHSPQLSSHPTTPVLYSIRFLAARLGCFLVSRWHQGPWEFKVESCSLYGEVCEETEKSCLCSEELAAAAASVSSEACWLFYVLPPFHQSVRSFFFIRKGMSFCAFLPSFHLPTRLHCSTTIQSAEPAFVASCQDCVLHVLRNRWPHFQWFDFIGQHLLQRSRMHFLNQIEPKCSSGLETIYGKPIPSDCRKIRE